MIVNIEFYNTPNGDVACKPIDGAMFILKPANRELVQDMLHNINELWPTAFKSLSEMYSKSSMNKEYYEYLMVHRFIRCNFGSYDTQHLDIDASGKWTFEQVTCPLRGECKFEGIICNPVLSTNLSDREMQITKMLCEMTPEEISTNECISLHTVYNHINSIKARLKVRNIGQIVAWYKSKCV